MKALVGAFNQEKDLVWAFSVIVQPVVEPMEHYTALTCDLPPLAARLLALVLHLAGPDLVHLRHERVPGPQVEHQPLVEQRLVLPHLLRQLLEHAVDDHVDVEQRPLILNILKLQRLSLVVISALVIFNLGPEPITDESFEAIFPLEVLHHGLLGDGVQVEVLGGEGGEGDGGQERRVRQLGVGLARQKGLENAPVSVVGIDIHIDHREVGPSLPEQVEAVDCLESSFGHADGAGADLGRAVIVLGAAAPAAVAGRAVGALDVVDEVLDEGDLLHAVDDLEAGGDHLHEEEEVEADHVQLEVVVLRVVEADGAAVEPHHRVQGQLVTLLLLPGLQLQC